MYQQGWFVGLLFGNHNTVEHNHDCEFDWRSVADQFIDLETTHPTRLRNTVSAAPCSSEQIERDRIPVEREKEKVGKIVEAARAKIRLLNYALTTETDYLGYIRKFCYFRLRRIREEVDTFEPDSTDAYLTFIALEREWSVSTH